MSEDQLCEAMAAKIQQLESGYVKYAKLAMLELHRTGHADFVLLRNEDLRKWWSNELERLQRRYTEYQKKLEEYNVKAAAWDRLTPAERRALGIRKPIAPSDPT